MKTQIITVYHKPVPYIIRHDEYLPIQVGKSLVSYDMGIQPDNEGENISELAPFSELRSLYWAWKNLDKDVEIVGMNHYRRFFDFYGVGEKYNWVTAIPESFFNKINFSIPPKILEFVKRGGIVASKPFHMKYSVEIQFKCVYGSRPLDLLQQVLRELHGNIYDEAYHKWIVRSNKFSTCGLFLMNRSEFDKYCNWLFPIAFRLHELIDYEKLDDFSYRMVGFLCERLFHLYIHAHNFSLKYIPMLYLDPNLKDEDYSKPTLQSDMGRLMINKSNDIGFSLFNFFCFHEFSWLNFLMDKITARKVYNHVPYVSQQYERTKPKE